MSSRRRARETPSLRIVAGEFRGRRLASPPALGARPTAGRTREAIFSMAGPIEGGAVLDLFCGSGALGLEALSRGAEKLTLVDREIATARTNVEALGVGERCELLEASLPEALAAAGPLAGRRYELILCDPPYTLAADLGPELDNALPRLLADGGQLIVESSAEAPMLLSLPQRRARAYGAAHVAIYGEPG